MFTCKSSSLPTSVILVRVTCELRVSLSTNNLPPTLSCLISIPFCSRSNSWSLMVSVKLILSLSSALFSMVSESSTKLLLFTLIRPLIAKSPSIVSDPCTNASLAMSSSSVLILSALRCFLTITRPSSTVSSPLMSLVSVFAFSITTSRNTSLIFS